MADIKFTNNASSLLNTSINATDLTIELQPGFGARFPSIGAGEYFLVALEDNAGNFEVVKITDYVSADVLEVASVADRGFDNTTAQAFTQNITRVECRAVAFVFNSLLQSTGDIMTGELDMNANNLVDAYLTGANTRMLAGQIVDVPIRGLLDTSGNEIVVPVDGSSRATVGGANILAEGDDLIAFLDTAGVIDLSSATVSVLIGTNTGAYLEIGDATGADYGRQSHDGTDYNWEFFQTDFLGITGLSEGILLGTGVSLDMAENELKGATIVDYAMKKQSVSSVTSTDVDYQLGSYVILTMTADITDLDITDFPTGEVASVRFKIVQAGSGSYTITNWPAVMHWIDGTAPVLSTAVGVFDFVDIWTDDGGSTWNGAFGTGWA